MTDFYGNRIIDPGSAQRALDRMKKEEYEEKMKRADESPSALLVLIVALVTVICGGRKTK